MRQFKGQSLPPMGYRVGKYLKTKMIYAGDSFRNEKFDIREPAKFFPGVAKIAFSGRR
jgi:hypothetical protein